MELLNLIWNSDNIDGKGLQMVAELLKLDLLVSDVIPVVQRLKYASKSKALQQCLCPNKFRLSTVMGLPEKIGAPALLGTSFHRVTDNVWDMIEPRKLAQFRTPEIEPYISNICHKIADRFHITTQTLNPLLECFAYHEAHRLDSLLESFSAGDSIGMSKLDFISRYYIPIVREKQFKSDKYHLSGRIDRAELNVDGSLTILDCKTGRMYDIESDVCNDDKLYELGLYKLLMEDENVRVRNDDGYSSWEYKPVKHLVMWYVKYRDDGIICYSDIDADAIQTIETRLLKYWLRIAENDLYETMNNLNFCKSYCSYFGKYCNPTGK
jgi:hypothetical protein